MSDNTFTYVHFPIMNSDILDFMDWQPILQSEDEEFNFDQIEQQQSCNDQYNYVWDTKFN